MTGVVDHCEGDTVVPSCISSMCELFGVAWSNVSWDIINSINYLLGDVITSLYLTDQVSEGVVS
jgi:hypothetical protein